MLLTNSMLEKLKIALSMNKVKLIRCTSRDGYLKGKDGKEFIKGPKYEIFNIKRIIDTHFADSKITGYRPHVDEIIYLDEKYIKLSDLLKLKLPISMKEKSNTMYGGKSKDSLLDITASYKKAEIVSNKDGKLIFSVPLKKYDNKGNLIETVNENRKQKILKKVENNFPFNVPSIDVCTNNLLDACKNDKWFITETVDPDKEPYLMFRTMEGNFLYFKNKFPHISFRGLNEIWGFGNNARQAYLDYQKKC
jgi:hypothetical protein